MPTSERALQFPQGAPNAQPALVVVSGTTVAKNVPAAPQVHPAPTECVLPSGLSFKGEARFPCGVQIEGAFDGKVTAASDQTITVAKGGRVKGEIKATNVHVEGGVDGQIIADGGLARFGATAKFTGEVTYARIGIEEGADIEASMKKLTPKVSI